jgi:hypothetical protein
MHNLWHRLTISTLNSNSNSTSASTMQCNAMHANRSYHTDHLFTQSSDDRSINIYQYLIIWLSCRRSAKMTSVISLLCFGDSLNIGTEAIYCLNFGDGSIQIFRHSDIQTFRHWEIQKFRLAMGTIWSNFFRPYAECVVTFRLWIRDTDFRLILCDRLQRRELRWSSVRWWNQCHTILASMETDFPAAWHFSHFHDSAMLHVSSLHESSLDLSQTVWKINLCFPILIMID